MGDLMKRLTAFLRAQPVLVIAFFAAAVTAFLIPPDAAYLGYCNRTVLIELFCLMAAVAGLRGAGLFEHAARMLLKGAGNIRRLGLIFVVLTGLSAMLVTNDVALLTFVPLTLVVYTGIRDEKSRILTIVLETAAANLGSMLTPVGNPQNLFLYEEFHLTALDFLRTMALPGILGALCLFALHFLLPKTACTADTKTPSPIPKWQTAGFTALFVLCLLTVFHVIPDWACLVAAVVISLTVSPKTLLQVDYALLATFVCFFVFVGNISRIEAVRELISGMMQGRELLVSALLSQVISNVPAAVMLANFTQEGMLLLLGVDIGGFGTLIASLASLISFQLYRKDPAAKSGRFLLVFSVINFTMLALLLVAEVVYLHLLH